MSARNTKTLTVEQRRRIFCVKHGHSRLREFCFGYHHCARCGDLLGDSLGGAYRDETAVYVGHMCRFARDGTQTPGCNCPGNATKLTKKDFALVPQWNSSGEEQRPPWREKPKADAALARAEGR